MPAQRTVTEINVANLYRRQDVRDELQILRKRIKARLQKHQMEEDGAHSFGLLFAAMHDSKTCLQCWNFTGQLEAIAEALRMFGGREAQAGKNRPEYLKCSPVERSEVEQ